MSTFSGLVAIVAPHFTAGIVIDCNRIKKAPPWLRYMECWTVEQLQKFVRDQHWKMVELERCVRLGDFAMSSAAQRSAFYEYMEQRYHLVAPSGQGV